MTDEREDLPKQPYDVGYGRPPERTRFQAGRSGNPKGRPKGVKNFTTLFREELAQPVTLTENGKRKRMPKGQVLIKRQINRALGDDPKATSLVFDQIRRGEASDDSVAIVDASRFQNPHVLQNIIHRIRLNAETAPEAPSQAGEEEP